MNQKINRKITTIGTEVANLLNKQIAIELNNNKIYLQFASELNQWGFKTGEEYYLLRAEEELRHAHMIMDLMRTNDCQVIIPNFPLEEIKIEKIIDTFVETVNVEINTTKELCNIYKVAMEQDEYFIAHWLMNGLIEIQYNDEESESRQALSIMKDETSGMLDRLKAVYKLIKK